jgi:hypothetical protein
MSPRLTICWKCIAPANDLSVSDGQEHDEILGDDSPVELVRLLRWRRFGQSEIAPLADYNVKRPAQRLKKIFGKADDLAHGA